MATIFPHRRLTLVVEHPTIGDSWFSPLAYSALRDWMDNYPAGEQGSEDFTAGNDVRISYEYEPMNEVEMTGDEATKVVGAIHDAMRAARHKYFSDPRCAPLKEPQFTLYLGEKQWHAIGMVVKVYSAATVRESEFAGAQVIRVRAEDHLRVVENRGT
jgi:hypothetical protein